jgi:hypothetical protein
MVRLTLLPLLASAAVASADNGPPGSAPPVQTAGGDAMPDPGAPPLDSLPVDFDTTFAPPGMTEPVLAPPGMTPPLDCQDDPDWEDRPECTVGGGVTVRGGVVRGGFGHYFWVGG